MQIKPRLESKYQEYVSVNNKDPYSKCIVTFAEAWADLMEEKIRGGGRCTGNIPDYKR